MPSSPDGSAGSPTRRLQGFIARYSPDLAARSRRILTKMRARLPGAVELVYDNYNGLVIGFGPTERSSDAPFSIVLYPRWVTLFFLRGVHLPDPARLLKGGGVRVRHIVLESPELLDTPAVEALVTAALREVQWRPTAGRRRRTVIRAVVAKQRPRRP